MEEEFYWPYKILSGIGLHPHRKISPAYFTFNIVLFIVISVLIFMQMYIAPKFESLESIMLIIMPVVKYVMFFSKRKELKKTLEDFNHFWTEELSEEGNEDVWAYIKLRKFYVVYIVLAATSITMQPVFKADSKLIYYCYEPEQIPYVVLQVLAFYLIFVGCSTIGAFNILICTMIILLVAQFRRLNERLKNLKLHDVRSHYDMERCLRKLKEYVDYHNFLITCVQRLNNILSIPITLLTGLTTLLVCANMYLVADVNVNIAQIYRPLMTTLAVIFEFFFLYGLPAQLLMDEAAAISDTIYYGCDWYLPNIIPIRKTLLMIMRRSQKPLYITGELNVVLNNQIVVMILKTAYSFYTFLSTIT